jgi:hypothetical protein
MLGMQRYFIITHYYIYETLRCRQKQFKQRFKKGQIEGYLKRKIVNIKPICDV